MSENIDRNLVLSGDVDDDSVKPLIEAIYQINEHDAHMRHNLAEGKYEVRPIRIIINTNGGGVHAGLALIGAIEMSSTPVHTFVIGKAFSMGLLIALAGHERYAHRLATFMYHELAGGLYDKVESQRRAIEEYSRMQSVLDDYIRERSQIPEEKLEKESLVDWHFTATEAFDMGVIDFLITVEQTKEEEPKAKKKPAKKAKKKEKDD